MEEDLKPQSLNLAVNPFPSKTFEISEPLPNQCEGEAKGKVTVTGWIQCNANNKEPAVKISVDYGDLSKKNVKISLGSHEISIDTKGISVGRQHVLDSTEISFGDYSLSQKTTFKQALPVTVSGGFGTEASQTVHLMLKNKASQRMAELKVTISVGIYFTIGDVGRLNCVPSERLVLVAKPETERLREFLTGLGLVVVTVVFGVAIVLAAVLAAKAVAALGAATLPVLGSNVVGRGFVLMLLRVTSLSPI